jgi:hypothetical protein
MVTGLVMGSADALANPAATSAAANAARCIIFPHYYFICNRRLLNAHHVDQLVLRKSAGDMSQKTAPRNITLDIRGAEIESI